MKCSLWVVALIAVWQTFCCSAFSTLSSFWGVSTSSAAIRQQQRSSRSSKQQASLVMYENSHDPPSSSSTDFNAFHVLTNTEKWVSQTLADANQQGGGLGSAASASGGNPYTRKEVSYVCEQQRSGPMIVAGIFRRLKEARERGEAHGVEQQEQGTTRTFRQTLVVVIPSNAALSDSFSTFDQLVTAINQARRNARDLITDTALERVDDKLFFAEQDAHHDDDDEDEVPWSVSVNCAHLHPTYGELTPEQKLQQMKQEEEDGEVDLHYQEYLEKRNKARRSPYPTVVIEVRSTPPMDFSQAPPPPSAASPASTSSDQGGSGVSQADIQKLEALFGKSAHVKTQDAEDAFYNAIGNSIDQQLTTLTELAVAQQWIAQNDPAMVAAGDDTANAAFTETDTPAVDAAYEFVFTNIAMLLEGNSNNGNNAEQVKRQYLLMPHFVSSAATSFEKFTMEVERMVACLPDVAGKLQFSTFHPEHIDARRRSPSPILALQVVEQKKE